MPNDAPRTVRLNRLRTAAQDRLEAIVRLVDTTGRVVRRVEKLLGEYGMTLPQFDVLSNLAMRDGLTQQELAARLQVTKGNVCGLLDRLEKTGLVRRRPDDTDGRINRLSITPAGQAKVDFLRPLHDAMLLTLVEPWAGEDVATLQRILAKIETPTET